MSLVPIEQTLDNGLVVSGWRTTPRGLPILVFLHGNGFSAGVYMPMHRCLEERFDLLLFDLPGHGKSDSVRPYVGWNQTSEIMHEALSKNIPDNGVPVFGVGHSLGAVLTLLAASKHRTTYDSLVLLDPIIFPRLMLFSMRVISMLGLTSRVHPLVRPTLRRRRSWPDVDQAYSYLHGRKIFHGWSENSLRSFTEHALRADNQQVSLCCSPEQEAHYFSSLPGGLWSALKNVPCSTTIVMGDQTYPFSLRAADNARAKSANIMLELVSGGHCFMQERPEDTALQIIKLLQMA